MEVFSRICDSEEAFWSYHLLGMPVRHATQPDRGRSILSPFWKRMSPNIACCDFYRGEP
jgi:hypothetical protein